VTRRAPGAARAMGKPGLDRVPGKLEGYSPPEMDARETLVSGLCSHTLARYQVLGWGWRIWGPPALSFQKGGSGKTRCRPGLV
jgi:hypothetical protein